MSEYITVKSIRGQEITFSKDKIEVLIYNEKENITTIHLENGMAIRVAGNIKGEFK